jgi:hypothetical protein
MESSLKKEKNYYIYIYIYIYRDFVLILMKVVDDSSSFILRKKMESSPYILMQFQFNIWVFNFDN